MLHPLRHPHGLEGLRPQRRSAGDRERNPWNSDRGSRRERSLLGAECPCPHPAGRAAAIGASPAAVKDGSHRPPPELSQRPPANPAATGPASRRAPHTRCSPGSAPPDSNRGPRLQPRPRPAPSKTRSRGSRRRGGGALGMLAGAGRARVRAASRKPSPRGGCGRERDGPRRRAHALRGLMPRASRLGAQLAAASAARRPPPPRPRPPGLPRREAAAVAPRRLPALSSPSAAQVAAAAAGCCGAPDPSPTRDALPPAGPAPGPAR